MNDDKAPKIIKSEHVDFQTIREDYSVYECENGQILKAKQAVGDVIHEMDDTGKMFSELGFKEDSLVLTTEKIDTSNLEFMRKEFVTKDHEVGELKFKTKRVIVNIYETSNSIILLAPMMKKIMITNKKDESNNPILRYVMNSGVSIIEKELLFGKDVPATKQKEDLSKSVKLDNE